MDGMKMYTIRVERATENDDDVPETCDMELHDHELSAFPNIYGMVKDAVAGPIPLQLPPTVTIGHMEWVVDWIRRKITVSAIKTKAEFQKLSILADFLSMEPLLNDLTVFIFFFGVTRYKEN